MTSQHYQVLSRRIYNNFPLIGWLLRRWTAKRLAKDGSGEAIAILAEAITRSRDQVVKDIAFPVLKQLKSQDAINGFCRIWVETRHKDLTSILKSRRYIGTESKLKVLSSLKVSSLNTLKTYGIEILDFLLAALNDKDTQIASAASNFIIQLENRAVIDELCKRWVDSRSNQLEQIIKRGGYFASQPIEVQVLTAFKFKQIIDEKVEIIDSLVNAINDKDIEIANASKNWAARLKKQQVIDALCRKWIDSQNIVLEEIIQTESYEPIEPDDKALFFFLIGSWQKYKDLDFDQSLLSSSYKRASIKIRTLIADKAKSGGRLELVKILTNDKQNFNTDEIKDEEWIACIEILSVQSDEEEIWNFLRNTPAIWNRKLIERLVEVSHNWLKNNKELTPAEMLFNIGNIKFYSRNVEGAFANFSESIKLDPNNPNPFFNRANIKYHLGDKRGAINDYSEAIKINPQYIDAWYARGVSKFELRDFQGALVDHHEAIKINPEFANAYFGRGNAKRALGDNEGANIDHDRGFRLQRMSY